MTKEQDNYSAFAGVNLSNARSENESYEDYKIRRKAEKLLLKNYLKGTPVEPNQGVPKENLTSWK